MVAAVWIQQWGYSEAQVVPINPVVTLFDQADKRYRAIPPDLLQCPSVQKARCRYQDKRTDTNEEFRRRAGTQTPTPEPFHSRLEETS